MVCTELYNGDNWVASDAMRTIQESRGHCWELLPTTSEDVPDCEVFMIQQWFVKCAD
jgi:hypothetical protein